MKTKNWEKEFDRRFEEIDLYSHLGTQNEKPIVKDFISQLLTSQAQEIIDEIKKMPTGMFDSTPYKKDLIEKLKKDYDK